MRRSVRNLKFVFEAMSGRIVQIRIVGIVPDKELGGSEPFLQFDVATMKNGMRLRRELEMAGFTIVGLALLQEADLRAVAFRTPHATRPAHSDQTASTRSLGRPRLRDSIRRHAQKELHHV